MSPTDVPPGYPPLRGEDILQYLYKLDPAVAEEFERQKADLKAQYEEVARMAASLRKVSVALPAGGRRRPHAAAQERERIAKEYPQPLKPGQESPAIDIRAWRRLHRRAVLTLMAPPLPLGRQLPTTRWPWASRC